MSYQEQRRSRERTAASKRTDTLCNRTNAYAAGRSRLYGGRRTGFVIVLGLVLLAAGCVRFTYDEGQTAVPDATASATPASVAGGGTPQVEPQDTRPTDGAPTPVPTMSGPTTLRIDPSVVNLAVGETRLVQVWLDNVEQVNSIEVHIGFDSRCVRIEDSDPDAEGIQIGPGVLPMPTQTMQNVADNGAGDISYQVAQAPGDSASGSGMVASFVARGVAEGGSPLRFTTVELRGPDEELLPAPQQIDGMVVVGSGDIAPGQAATPRPASIPTSPAPTVPQETVYHTVQAGENLFRIALRYGTTVEAIVAANHLPDEGSIQVGQELLIPAGSQIGADTYTVQPGDTLYSIARRFDTTVETLAALNGIAPPYAIEVGQVLNVAP